jgi:branched-subunit amino acid transport protein
VTVTLVHYVPPAIVVAWFTKNTLLTILAGMLALFVPDQRGLS